MDTQLEYMKMNKRLAFGSAACFRLTVVFACFWCCSIALRAEEQVTLPLWARGYAVLPEPQKVKIGDQDFQLDESWVVLISGGANREDIAVRVLRDSLRKEFDLNLVFASSSNPATEKVLELAIRPETVATDKKEEISRQAYVLETNPARVKITGNAGPGLLYGVSTLIQLLRSKSAKQCLLPQVIIEDWPDLELREIHWDSQYHQDRFETLKDYIDRAAIYKVNGIGFSLKDKLAYERHPLLGAPGAFTKIQIKDLFSYARERYIELTPMIQAPSHMSYVLKHPQFAHLREDITNNFQICTSKPESWDLIFDLFEEAIEATPGGRFFHVGTDESWFYGTGADCPCAEKVKKVGKSGLFVEFVNKTAEFLEKRGREMRIWAEFPLKAVDVPKLPSSIIDAVVNASYLDGEGGLEIEREHGIRGMIYASIHGGGAFFSDYPKTVRGAYETISLSEARKNNLLGTFIAAWDESGPHNEIFWLGWVGGTSYGWKAGAPDPEILIPQFMVLFYGPESGSMQEAYNLLARVSKFWSSSWDRVPSLRELNYGGSYGPRKSPLKDASIDLPRLPDPATLYNHPYWKQHYQEVLAALEEEKAAASQLLALLEENLGKAERNVYNLEVMQANARYLNHNLSLLETLSQIEDTLSEASNKRERHQYAEAVQQLLAAEEQAERICRERESSYASLKAVWEKSQYPKGRSVDGRDFVHIESNTWSGGGNRTPDLSYLVRRERRLNLEKWIFDLKSIRQGFALQHQFEIPLELLYPPD